MKEMTESKKTSLKKIPGKTKVEIVNLTEVSFTFCFNFLNKSITKLNLQKAYMEMSKAKYEINDSLPIRLFTNSTLTRVKEVISFRSFYWQKKLSTYLTRFGKLLLQRQLLHLQQRLLQHQLRLQLKRLPQCLQQRLLQRLL